MEIYIKKNIEILHEAQLLVAFHLSNVLVLAASCALQLHHQVAPCTSSVVKKRLPPAGRLSELTPNVRIM